MSGALRGRREGDGAQRPRLWAVPATRGTSMAEWFLAVGPDDGQVSLARGWARRQVTEFPWPTRWRPDPEAVALVVSELVTNALRHVGGTTGLWLVFGP